MAIAGSLPGLLPQNTQNLTAMPHWRAVEQAGEARGLVHAEHELFEDPIPTRSSPAPGEAGAAQRLDVDVLDRERFELGCLPSLSSDCEIALQHAVRHSGWK